MTHDNGVGLALKRILRTLVVLLALFAMACGGGGGGDGSGGSNNPAPTNTANHVLSFGGMADNITLVANQPVQTSFIGQTPGTARNYDSITLNLQDMLNSGYVADASGRRTRFSEFYAKTFGVSRAAAANQFQVAWRIGPAQMTTVCEDGLLYGPYILSGALGPETSDTAEVTAEPATVSQVNKGSFALCIEISSSVDMNLSISDYSVDVTTCEEPAADFSGTWTGDYSCFNTGCPDEGGPITLTVTQTGHSAQYIDDLGATFEGTVCGSVFTFNGGVPGPDGFEEDGTLTLNSDGSATKQSSFINLDASCSGDCSDTLTL